MRLVVDLKKCRRSGQCAYLHRELFTIGADGFPVVQVEHPNEDAREAAEEAVDLCPGGAIALVEER